MSLLSDNLRPRDLHRAALGFNFLPARYAHSSWYGTGVHALRLSSLTNEAAVSTASQWLLQRHGLAGRYDFDTRLAKRFAWLEPIALNRLATAIGAMRHRAALVGRVDGGLQTLSAALGAPVVRFILARHSECAVLSAPGERLNGCRDEDLLPGLLSAGAPWLFGLWPETWLAVRTRALLKFPRGFQAGHEQLDEADRRRLETCVQDLALRLELQ